MAVSDELKPGPCPFCGSDKTAVCGGPSLVDPDTPQFYVECNGNRKQCAALGPDATTEAEAIARWNAAGQIQKFWKEQSEWALAQKKRLDQLVAAYELVLWFEGATSVPTSESKESR